MSFQPTKTGILVPKPKATPCGYCPDGIWAHNEAGGKIHTVDGKPICAKCRIMKSSRYASRILNDKKKYKKDVEARKELQQRNENERMIDVAIASQKRHNVRSDKAKLLSKKTPKKQS